MPSSRRPTRSPRSAVMRCCSVRSPATRRCWRRCAQPTPGCALSYKDDPMPDRLRLADRHALLTGAGGGIGLAVTEAFLAEGARCTAVDVATEPGAGLAALMSRHPGRLA